MATAVLILSMLIGAGDRAHPLDVGVAPQDLLPFRAGSFQMTEWTANPNGPHAVYRTASGSAEFFVGWKTEEEPCKNSASSKAKRVTVRGMSACLRVWNDESGGDVDLDWVRDGFWLSWVLRGPVAGTKAKATADLQSAAEASDAWFEGCFKAGASTQSEFRANRGQISPLFDAREVTVQGDMPGRQQFFFGK